MTADDSWLNLTDQDLEEMLPKYSDPNSREASKFAGENTAKSSVSACESARYTVEFFLSYPPPFPGRNVEHPWSGRKRASSVRE